MLFLRYQYLYDLDGHIEHGETQQHERDMVCVDTVRGEREHGETDCTYT